MPLDLSPQSLRALVTVLETGSITAAADRLGFTQSALSKQIGTLERQTGARLFERTARGVEATAAARRLARRAVTVLEELEALERDLVDAPGLVEGRVRLGAFPTAAMALVPQALARVQREHPGVTVDFAEASTPVQLRRVRAGRLDLAVVAVGETLDDHDLSDLVTEPLPAGPLLVAVAVHHRLAQAERVDVTELAGESWVAGRGQRGAPQFGAWPTLTDPTVVAGVAEWSTRLGFVAAGLGVTVVPTLVEGVLPAGVVALEVDDPALLHRSLTLVSATPPAGPAGVVRRALLGAAGDIAARRSGSPDRLDRADRGRRPGQSRAERTSSTAQR